MISIPNASGSYSPPALAPVPRGLVAQKEGSPGGHGYDHRGLSAVLMRLAILHNTKEGARHAIRQTAGVAGLGEGPNSCGGRSTAECMFTTFTYINAVLRGCVDDMWTEGDGPPGSHHLVRHADFTILVPPESQPSLRCASARSWGSCLGLSAATRLPTHGKPSPPGWQRRLASERLCWRPRSAVL